MCPLPWSLAYTINYVGLVQFSTHLKEEMDLPLVVLTQTIYFDATFVKKIQVYLQAELRLHVRCTCTLVEKKICACVRKAVQL